MTIASPPGDPLLRDEILDRVRADLIVRALTKEPDEARSRGGFWKHPAVLIFIPFILTTVVGTWLANAWQTRQWIEQQEYTRRQEIAKTRIELMTDFTLQVGEVFGACEDVLVLYQTKLRGELRSKGEVADRVEALFEKNRKWIVAEKVLYARIQANFADPSSKEGQTMQTILGQIRENRKDLFVTIRNLLEESGGPPFPEEREKKLALVKLHNHAYTVIQKTTGEGGLVPQLGRLMIERARHDQVEATRAPLFDVSLKKLRTLFD